MGITVDRASRDGSPKRKKKRRTVENSTPTEVKQRRKKHSSDVERKSPTEKTASKKRKRRVKTSKDLAVARDKIEALEGQVLENMPTPIGDEAKYMDEYMALFYNLKSMRRMAERSYRKSKSSRDIYALMALYSQQREVIADIRSVTDLSEHANLLIREVMEPLLNAIAQNVLDSYYSTQKIILASAEDGKAEKALTDAKSITREQANFVQNQYDIAAQKLLQMFSDIK
jgi:hypothetical protein